MSQSVFLTERCKFLNLIIWHYHEKDTGASKKEQRLLSINNIKLDHMMLHV